MSSLGSAAGPVRARNCFPQTALSNTVRLFLKSSFCVIVCLLEDSQRSLPAVMIFLQQRKDLQDHLSDENSQQKAAGWSLHVVAFHFNLRALPRSSILLFYSLQVLFSSSLFFPLFFLSMYPHACFLDLVFLLQSVSACCINFVNICVKSRAAFVLLILSPPHFLSLHFELLSAPSDSKRRTLNGVC